MLDEEIKKRICSVSAGCAAEVGLSCDGYMFDKGIESIGRFGSLTPSAFLS
jgi:hypothetical protein